MKDAEKKWSTERETPTMEQSILPLVRMAFLSLWKDPGGIPPTSTR